MCGVCSVVVEVRGGGERKESRSREVWTATIAATGNRTRSARRQTVRGGRRQGTRAGREGRETAARDGSEGRRRRKARDDESEGTFSTEEYGVNGSVGTSEGGRRGIGAGIGAVVDAGATRTPNAR